MRLEGSVVIVTGGANGIGSAYVKGLASAGAKVVIADIDLDNANKLQEEIHREGGDSLAIKTDVTSREDTLNMARIAAESFGRIDILVNNAAVMFFERGGRLGTKTWEELTVEDWDRFMSVNVRGPFLCVQAVVPYMKKQGKGKIINISSRSILVPPSNMLCYVTTKGAVFSFTRALARELGQFNINVNSILPGLTESDTIKNSYPAEIYDQIVSNQCVKRREQPEDLVGTLLYLASPHSDFVTGQCINVDGGMAFH